MLCEAVMPNGKCSREKGHPGLCCAVLEIHEFRGRPVVYVEQLPGDKRGVPVFGKPSDPPVLFEEGE